MEIEELEKKLLDRPIDSDTKVNYFKVEKKEDFLFLFEESFWDGISISSIILLKKQF